MSNTAAWNLALVIGLVAALIVAGLLVLLIKAVRDIEGSVNGLLDVATSVAEQTANIPQLEATAPVLGLIVEEAIVQDGYMNALTDGYPRTPSGRMSGHALLSILLAVVVVAVLAVALIEVRNRLRNISNGLATLATALETVESEHLKPLEPAVKAINAQFDIILSALPGIGAKAAIVAERRPR